MVVKVLMKCDLNKKIAMMDRAKGKGTLSGKILLL